MSLLLIAIVQVSHYNSNLKEDKNQSGSRNRRICVGETVGCDVATPIRTTFFFLFFNCVVLSDVLILLLFVDSTRRAVWGASRSQANGLVFRTCTLHI
jgi:hypothetical protein